MLDVVVLWKNRKFEVTNKIPRHHLPSNGQIRKLINFQPKQSLHQQTSIPQSPFPTIQCPAKIPIASEDVVAPANLKVIAKDGANPTITADGKHIEQLIAKANLCLDMEERETLEIMAQVARLQKEGRVVVRVAAVSR